MTDPLFPADAPTGRGAAPDADDFSRAPERGVFALLDRLGVAHSTVAHPPTRTVADSKLVKTDIPGAHTKNLFMKDKRGALVLVSAAHDTVLPLNRLHKATGTQRLSFTDAELLWQALGVTPGSVSAFALMHDPAARVQFVIDQALEAHEVWNFHPLRNDMTTSVSREGFRAFLAGASRGPRDVKVIDFRQLAQEPGEG